jgi:UPF0716 protein FxsA
VIIAVATAIGLLNTLALLVAISCIGAYIVKRQGLGMLRRISRERSEGRLPGAALADGALVLIAGLLLLVPGFLTDGLGLLLLLAPVRRAVRAGGRRWWTRRLPWERRYRRMPGTVPPEAPIRRELPRSDR